jgi:hypothetical protein
MRRGSAGSGAGGEAEFGKAQRLVALGSDAGLRWAREMGRDPNLSESTRRAMEQIARGVMALREDLERLSPLERLRVFGWVARLLRIREHESFSTPARRR